MAIFQVSTYGLTSFLNGCRVSQLPSWTSVYTSKPASVGIWVASSLGLYRFFSTISNDSLTTAKLSGLKKKSIYYAHESGSQLSRPALGQVRPIPSGAMQASAGSWRVS